eukprot:8544866-Pyramimonas_sp.AAC.1
MSRPRPGALPCVFGSIAKGANENAPALDQPCVMCGVLAAFLALGLPGRFTDRALATQGRV